MIVGQVLLYEAQLRKMQISITKMHFYLHCQNSDGQCINESNQVQCPDIMQGWGSANESQSGQHFGFVQIFVHQKQNSRSAPKSGPCPQHTQPYSTWTQPVTQCEPTTSSTKGISREWGWARVVTLHNKTQTLWGGDSTNNSQHKGVNNHNRKLNRAKASRTEHLAASSGRAEAKVPRGSQDWSKLCVCEGVCRNECAVVAVWLCKELCCGVAVVSKAIRSVKKSQSQPKKKDGDVYVYIRDIVWYLLSFLSIKLSCDVVLFFCCFWLRPPLERGRGGGGLYFVAHFMSSLPLLNINNASWRRVLGEMCICCCGCSLRGVERRSCVL